MTRLIRQGECNICGECCGSGGVHPWPASWPASFSNWRDIVDIENSWPLMKLVPFMHHDNHWILTEQNKEIYVHGVGTITYEVHPDHGFTKPGTTQCPYLGDGPDETHPCRLVGTQHDAIFTDFCKDSGGGAPKHIFEDILDKNGAIIRSSQEQKDDWFNQFPSCSFTYIEDVM